MCKTGIKESTSLCLSLKIQWINYGFKKPKSFSWEPKISMSPVTREVQMGLTECTNETKKCPQWGHYSLLPWQLVWSLSFPQWHQNLGLMWLSVWSCNFDSAAFGIFSEQAQKSSRVPLCCSYILRLPPEPPKDHTGKQRRSLSLLLNP